MPSSINCILIQLFVFNCWRNKSSIFNFVKFCVINIFNVNSFNMKQYLQRYLQRLTIHTNFVREVRENTSYLCTCMWASEWVREMVRDRLWIWAEWKSPKFAITILKHLHFYCWIYILNTDSTLKFSEILNSNL